MEEFNSDFETLKHIKEVNCLLLSFCAELMERAKIHDSSKLETPERENFAQYGPELSKTEYCSLEYKELLLKVKPAIEHHYSKNRHHPEHYPNGINDFNLVDVMRLESSD